MTPGGTGWEAQAERATRFWMRLLFWIALRLGRKAARAVLVPTIAYYWMTGRTARRASREYLRRVLPAPPTALQTLRHLYSFAAVTLDRIYIMAGRHDLLEVREDRPAEVARVADSGNGCILLTSHLGSVESMRVSAVEWLHLPIKALMDRAHGRIFMSMLDALNVRVSSMVIDSSQGGPALALEIRQALDDGHMVCMMADRLRAGERAIVVDFLGGRARMPVAPWLLAHAMRVPVLIGFGLHLGDNRYRNCVELFAERIEFPRAGRDEAVRRCVQRYADRLAHHARSAPYNWFNFYDYWIPPDEAAGP